MSVVEGKTQQRDDQTEFKESKRLCDQLDNKQTDLVLHARERQDKERRKKGEGVSKSKKGGWV